MKAHSRLAAALLPLLLLACGGGGGGGGDDSPRLRVAPANIVASARTTGVAPMATLAVSILGSTSRTIIPVVEHTSAGIARVETSIDTAARTGQVRVFLKDPDRLGPGVYDDQVILKACYDPACTEQIGDSPRVVGVKYTVTGPAATEPEPALPDSAAPTDGGLLPSSATLAMGDHNVVEAAYSKSLESIVMISTQPVNALYVYDTAGNSERRLDLSEAPTALALSPDGRTAVLLLGGDRLAHVELAATGALELKPPLDLSAAFSELLLGGNRVAQLLPAPLGGASFGYIFSINIDTSAPQFGAFGTPANLSGELHPAGQSIYAIAPLPAHGDILRFDISAGAATKLYESDDELHPGCGRLWLSATGNRIYTACGNVFRASEFRQNDLTHMGIVTLYRAGSGIQALSDSVDAGEIALVENSNEACYRTPSSSCEGRLSFYDRQTLAAAESYAIPAGHIAGFVFHDAGGGNVYLILRKFTEPGLPPSPPDHLLLKLARP